MLSTRNFLFSFLLFFTFLSRAHAEEKNFIDRLGATASASYSFGSIQNTRLALPSRTLSALSLEAMGGYRLGDFLVGLIFDFRSLGQLTSLADAGNTNLEGSSWILGLGGRYIFNSKWSLQGSFGFLGKYSFSNQTATLKESGLSGPLSFRIKPQFFLTGTLPLSVDLDLRYLSWRNFDVASTSYKISTSEFSIGAGVTYHFGRKTLRELEENNTPASAEKIYSNEGAN